MRLPEKNSATFNFFKVALWVGGSAIVTWFVSQVTAKPELFNPVIVLFVNSFGVFIKDFFNKNTPNY